MRPVHNLRVVILGAATLVAPLCFGQTPQPLAKFGSLHELSASFEELASRVRPAVVQIFSTGYVAAEENDNATPSALISKQQATGSGVIMTADGYIVTNNHVIQNARKIEVRFSTSNPGQGNGGRVIAKLVGTDRSTDIAVIKVERKNLPFLALADSQSVRQGQVVMAFGNPLGLEGSVSTGIVSSVARRLKADDPMVYVQTDAPINPGNSGGPLVDTDGHVVGINTMIYTQGGGSEGIGFAVPANAVRNVYEQIRKDGHVHRGQIGIVAQTITPEMAKGLGLSQDWGVVAADVTPDGPADKVGVKIRDIILSLNGRLMEDAPQIETAIYRLKLTEAVDVRVLRDGKQIDFTVPVIERDDDPQRFADMVNPDDNLISKLGILGIPLDEKLADKLGDLRHDYGIVVAARGGSPPYSGPLLEPGDVIYEINRTPAVASRLCARRWTK